MRVEDIRNYFIDALQNQNYVTDKSGCKMLELPGASFLADEPLIFGKPNPDYIERELEWYLKESLNVNDIPGDVPQIWKDVSDRDGYINSNYGYLVYNRDNGSQFLKVWEELVANPNSRRAVMIYNRPSIHEEYDRNGMSDFICTNAVQYLLRDDKLNAIVQMRSNDVVFGYKNDYAWQEYVLNDLVENYNLAHTRAEDHISPGTITWQVGSLHIYQRHFKFVEAEILKRQT